MNADPTAPSFVRDIPEWKIPEAVLSILLKDCTTGRNLLWATDDYAARGPGFGANDEMQLRQIADAGNPVIRPRVDKNAAEQRQRAVRRARKRFCQCLANPAHFCRTLANRPPALFTRRPRRHRDTFCPP